MKTIRKVLAILGIIGLLALYAVTFILAVSGKASKELLMACVLCTVLIPGILYAMMLVARILDRRNRD